MKRLLPLGLLVFLFAACESAVEPAADLTLQTRAAVEVLPADVQFIAMADLQALKRNEAFTPFGEGVGVGEMSGEASARLGDLIKATGFDPDRDLREVYVAGTPHGESPSLVAYANLDRDRLQDYIDDELAGAFAQTDYSGIPLYVHRESDEPLAFAIVNETMIVAAPEEALVHAMLDRLAGQGRALKDDPEAMRLVQQVGDADAWVVTRGLTADAVPHHVHSTDPVLKNVGAAGQAVQDAATALYAERDGIRGRVYLVPQQGVAVRDVGDLLRGAVAAMRAVPEANGPFGEALDEVEVKEHGEAVHVAFRLDNAVLESME